MAKILKTSEVSHFYEMNYVPLLSQLFSSTQEPIERIVREGAAVLNSGGVVALPTDTIYGIAASVNSVEGIERLYEIKGRNRGKPIAICVGDLDDVDK